MSIIKVVHLIRPSDGGIKKHLLTLLEGSDRERFEHIVACPPGHMAEAFSAGGAVTFPVPLKGELLPSGDMRVVRMLVPFLKGINADILHVHGSKAGLVGRPAARLAGVRGIVMTVHNSIFYDCLPCWKERLYAFSERMLARFTGRIITVSDSLRREIIQREKIDPEKIVTVYNGININHFDGGADRSYLERATGIPSGRKVVGVVARLAPQKGVSNFIAAAARLSLKIDGLVFVVIGNGPMREELEKEAGGLNLSGKLFFAGERKDVPAIMPCLDVLVLPSVTEGLPLAILEAMAAGRPVVATRVGGVPEAVLDGRTGLLVEPGDVDGLAAAMASVIADEEGAQRMGKEGRARVMAGFSAGKMIRDTEEIYQGLVSGS